MTNKYIKCDFCEVFFDNKCSKKYTLAYIRESYCKRAIKRMIKALKEVNKNER